MNNRYLWGAVLLAFFLVPGAVSAYSGHDRTPPKVTTSHVQSNGTNPAEAKAGDRVTITFTTSEEVRTPIVVVETKILFVRATNSGGNAWEASYIVDPRDREGRIDYLITLVDRAGNVGVCASRKFFIIPACASDGSNVSVVTTTTPPPDTTPPVISATADSTVPATSPSGAVVTYTTPTATDNVDGTVPVSCTPLSGSTFPIGSTVVTCSATDAAGNSAQSTFTVVVTPLPDTTPPALTLPEPITVAATTTAGAWVFYTATATDNVDGAVTPVCAPASGTLFAAGTATVNCTATDTAGNSASGSFSVTVTPYVPQPVTILSQPDESNFCSPSWEACYTNFGFERVINLGQINSQATIKSVTIARDPNAYPPATLLAFPWSVYLKCYTNASYTTACSDWIVPTPSGYGVNVMGEFADATTDYKYWAADFAPGYTFRPEYYYQLVISDNGVDMGAYGSLTEPYWVLTGLQ